MPDGNQIPFDYLGAVKAGYSDDEIQSFLKQKYDFNFDIGSAKKSGYSDNEISSYITNFQPAKKKDVGVSPTPSSSNGLSQLGKSDWSNFSFGENKPNETALDPNDPLLDAQRRADIIRLNPGKKDIESFAKASRQVRDISNVTSTNGYVGDKFISKIIGDDPNKYSVEQLQQLTKNNQTAQSAISGIADKRKVDEAINTTTDPYRAAVKYATGKENEQQDNITDEQKGEAFKQFKNNPNVSARANADSQFAKSFAEAKFNWMNDFPSTAQKDIKEKVAKKLVDDGKAGLFTDPLPNEIDKAASDVLDSHEMSIYNKDLKPNIGTIKEVWNGQTIPTPDIVHTALRAFDKGQGDMYEGARHFIDNLSGGAVSALGENADARQKRILENVYSTPQVEPNGKAAKIASGAVDMAAYMMPSIIGSLAGAPVMGAMGAQFYGNNWVNGMKLFPDDKEKQEGYATLTTAVDLMAGQKLPIKGAGDAIKSILGDVESGAITKETGKERFLNFLTDTFHGTNAIKAMEIGHNAAEKVFDGKNIDLEEEVKNAIKTYPEGIIPMAFFSGVAHGANFLGSRALAEEKPISESVPSEVQNKIIPQSDNIVPDSRLRTMDMGVKEGQKVTEEDKRQLQDDFLKGDVPIDGENGKGETARSFVGRVIPRFEEIKQTEPDNTTIITHSSAMKAIKTWEDPDTWKGIEKPTDPSNLNDEQWKRYAEAFNKESTENGEMESFKGTNGDINVIRHGETEDNKENKFRSGNTNLTDKGIQQAKDVSQELKQKTGGEVPKIITSDLPRAIHTSNIINDELVGTTKTAEATTETPKEETKPTKEIFNEELPLNIKYKSVKVNDLFTGEEQEMSASKGKRMMEKQHNILDKLINCLT